MESMEEFIVRNKDWFIKKVAQFDRTTVQPPQLSEATPKALSDLDIVIGARLRPLLPKEVDDGQIPGVSIKKEHALAQVHEMKRTPRGWPSLSSASFKVDRIYGPDDTSEAVYRDLVEPLIPWAWGGGVSTFFAYGQTGSGKTYTVSALDKLAAQQLMDGSLEGTRVVYLCIFELAGKRAYDLLNDRSEVKLLEDSLGEMQVAGVVEQQPSSAEELTALIEKGMSFRASAPTLKNDTSSRSHAVCRIRIANEDFAEIPDGLLYLIDLAGNEAAVDTKKHNKARIIETKDINLSLATLKDCIRGRSLWGVAEKGTAKSVHVPYRNSVLTKVLKHVFDIKEERACKTAVLACVTPNLADCGPTKNTLRYAETLRLPAPKPKALEPRINTPSTWSNKNLRRWIDKNSGEPPISSQLLAPSETGTQLCKLPKGEFLARCLKTSGATQAQAQTLFDELSRIHLESQSSNKTAELSSTDSEF